MGAKNGHEAGSGQERGRKAWEVQGNSGEVPGTSQAVADRFVHLARSEFFDVSPHGAGSVTRADLNNMFLVIFPIILCTGASDFQLGRVYKKL